MGGLDRAVAEDLGVSQVGALDRVAGKGGVLPVGVHRQDARRSGLGPGQLQVDGRGRRDPIPLTLVLELDVVAPLGEEGVDLVDAPELPDGRDLLRLEGLRDGVHVRRKALSEDLLALVAGTKVRSQALHHDARQERGGDPGLSLADE